MTKKNNGLRGKFKNNLNVGDKIYKLTVIEELPPVYDPNGRTKRFLKLLCDCGNVCEKEFGSVYRKSVKSCGVCPAEMPYKDLTGLKLGRLEVQSFSRRDHSVEGVFWNCKCSCGRSVEYTSIQLSRRMVYNCGNCGSSTKSCANYIEDEVIMEKDGYLCLPMDFTKNKRSYKVVIMDEHLTEIEVQIGNYRTGSFINPNTPRVQGVGYYGQGKYVAKVNDVHTDEYADWRSMLLRCYSGRYSAYEQVTVCKEWHNFQNFAEWANNNGIGKGKNLDKDLLVKGSKVYSPETCTYLPQNVNTFIKRQRFNDLPLGVDVVDTPNGTRFRSQGCFEGKVEFYGLFSKVEDAFYAYKDRKEAIAKILAGKYKHCIDDRAYNALMNYTVSIED